MKKEELTYEAAMQQLEEIVAGFEQGNLEIVQLSNKLKEAQELLKDCKTRLLKVETDVKKILDHEHEYTFQIRRHGVLSTCFRSPFLRFGRMQL